VLGPSAGSGEPPQFGQDPDGATRQAASVVDVTSSSGDASARLCLTPRNTVQADVALWRSAYLGIYVIVALHVASVLAAI
jgi:hypothetical protein